MGKSLILCLAALLAGCSAAPVVSEFGDEAPPRARPVVKTKLNCKNEDSIRSFKDFALSEVQPDPDEVERWAVCVCGAPARRAGVNGVRPRPAESAPMFPSYDMSNPDQSLARIRDWLKAHLPLNEEQAGKLTDCLYGRP